MKACLIIHGFTGSPFEVEPLADALRLEGYIVEVPILAGHGHDEDLQDVCWTDWISSAEAALKPMIGKYEELHIIGFSMGALIATYLSTKYPATKLVLLSPAIYHMNYRQLFENMSIAIKKRFTESVSSEFKQYIAKATNTPLRSVIDFRRLAQQLAPYLEEVTMPTLILQGKKDTVVDPKSASQAFDAVKSKNKKLLFLEKSSHIVCRGEEFELVNTYVIDFLKE